MRGEKVNNIAEELIASSVQYTLHAALQMKRDVTISSLLVRQRASSLAAGPTLIGLVFVDPFE